MDKAIPQEFTSEDNIGTLLGVGEHKVKITSATLTEASPAAEYKDRTPQLAVKFQQVDGNEFFTHWYNLRGFISEEGSYKVDKEGNRVIDEENTKTAISIVCKLGANCGIPEGTKFKFSELVGKLVGINIELNDRNNLRVHHSMSIDKVLAKVADAVEAVE